MSINLKILSVCLALCCGAEAAVGDQGKRSDSRDRAEQERYSSREPVGEQRRAALRAALRDQRQANKQGARQGEMRQMSPEDRAQLRQQLRQQRQQRQQGQDSWRQPQ